MFRFLDGPARYFTLEDTLNEEYTDKYFPKYIGEYQASIHDGSIPTCFGKCIKTVDEISLTPDEKNWMRECYFKRVNASTDFQYLIMQKLVQHRANTNNLPVVS